MIASALCIVVGTALVSVPAHRFTLRWQHTVEKIAWEEDYIVAGEWFYLSGARVRGSGAGMEPPTNAVKLGETWGFRQAAMNSVAMRMGFRVQASGAPSFLNGDAGPRR